MMVKLETNDTKQIVAIGATSGIVQALLRRYAAPENKFFLIARNDKHLQQVQQDLLARGAGVVETRTQDLAQIDSISSLTDELRLLPVIHTLIMGHGSLCDTNQCAFAPDKVIHEVHTNYLSSLLILNNLTPYFMQQRQGQIVALSSVAADRGRQSNYLYGSTKAGLTTYLQGLRNLLDPYQVQVLTVKPGFIDTPMTEGRPIPPLLKVSPEICAQAIERGLNSGQDQIYTPRMWQFIMWVICRIPERLFKKLKL